MKSSKKNQKSNKTGPKATVVKVEGDWEAAVDKALHKPRPESGWPKPDKKKRREQ